MNHPFEFEKQIIFFTVAIGTRWIFYQQFLLNLHFPWARKIIINGNVRFDFSRGTDCVWYDFAKQSVSLPDKIKYFVCIDEDCFITNPAMIYDQIGKLERDNLSLIGPSEVIEKIRGENPMALNSFFMIGKISDLKTVFLQFDLNLRFKDLNISLAPIEKEKIEYEPYYVFFWNYYQKGFKIDFLNTGFHQQYHCTTLLDDSNDIWALHMWLTRYWNRSIDFCGMPNRDRYLLVRSYLKEKFKFSWFDLLISVSITDCINIFFGRFITKNVNRLLRKLSHRPY